MRSILLSAMLVLAHFCQAQSNEIRTIAKSFLNTVEENAYHSQKINWRRVYSELDSQIVDIKTEKDLLPYFESILTQLQENVSSIHYFSQVINTEDSENNDFTLLRMYSSLQDTQVDLPQKYFHAELLDNKYAYINIPGTLTELDKYVSTLYNQFIELDKQNPEAWIIDLSECAGGEIFAIRMNLLPFLTDGKSFYYINNQNQSDKYEYNIRNTNVKQFMRYNSFLALNKIEQYASLHLKNKKKPIVVLTSAGTAESGETLLATLHGKKNVTTIGTTTAGKIYPIVSYPIGKHYKLNLAETTIKDRKGKIYEIGEGISPDVVLDIQIPASDSKEFYPAIHQLKPFFIQEAIKYLDSKTLVK